VSESDPAREQWLARMRELSRRDADELVPRPEFAVSGLAAPPLRPAVLTEAGQVKGEWQTVGLGYGDWSTSAGPWVVVASRAPSAGPVSRGGLLRFIDSDRNRLADHAWVDEDEPAGLPDYWQATVRSGDRDVAAMVGRHGTVLAAALRPDPDDAAGATVTVLSRGVPLPEIRLALVTDLEPYLRGREELLRQVAELQRRRPPPVLDHAEGMAAYRALADAEVSMRLRGEVAIRAGRLARNRAGDDAMIAALRQRAVRELRDRAQMSEHAAEDLISSVVNHVITLAERAEWFIADKRLRDRAIDETLRHAVLGERVSSGGAQRAWDGYWGYRTSVAVRAASEPLRKGAQVGTDVLMARLLDAWTEWSWQR
jgi:hypothetical protein